MVFLDKDTLNSELTSLLENEDTEHLNIAKIHEVLEAGADPNLFDNLGRTALNTACHKNNINAVSVLLKHGADPNMPNKFGEPPLNYVLL